MDRQNCLIIGCGGCGCKQLDELLNIDNRYASLFVNTNLAEMDILDNYTERNSFYIPNADGTGKDRSLAKKYFTEEQANLIGLLRKFANQPYIYLLASADGGTGSAAIIALSKIINVFLPEKQVNIILTIPSLNVNRKSLENTIDTWNELISLRTKKIIKSIQFIDNNKEFANNTTNKETLINKKAMTIFDKSFDMVDGSIDNSDLEKAHNYPGYKIILPLKNIFNNISEAIIDARNESVFYLPEINTDNSTIYQCKQMLGSINEVYNEKELNKVIESFEFSKINVTDDESILMLSGCKIPRDIIELINEALKETIERETRFDDNNNDDDLFIKRDNVISKETINEISSDNEKSKKKKSKSRVSKEEFKRLLKDL